MKDKISVFIYSSTYLPIQGGLQYYLYWQLKWLDENMHEISRLYNVRFVFITSSEFNSSASKFKNIPVFFLHKNSSFVQSICQIRNIIRQCNTENSPASNIIHAHSFGRDGLVSNICSLLTKSSSVLTAHGEDIAYLKKFSYGARLSIKGALVSRINALFVTHATTISEDMLSYLRQIISARKLSLIPNFYNQNAVISLDQKIELFYEKKYQMKSYGFNILTLSGARRIKGHSNLVLAFERFSKRYPDSHAKLYIASHGTETASIKLQVQQLGISDLVSFTGFVSGEEKAYLFNNADLYINTAYFEPFGLVYLEAVQYSLPVVASIRGGGRDIFKDCSYTKLIDPDSVDSIYQAIVELYTNKTSFPEYEYSQILERYCPNSIMLKFLELYQSLE